MIARLRGRHRRTWVVAAIALAAILLAALLSRPSEIIDDDGLEAVQATTADDAEGAP